jgi:hypothetical protein
MGSHPATQDLQSSLLDRSQVLLHVETKEGIPMILPDLGPGCWSAPVLAINNAEKHNAMNVLHLKPFKVELVAQPLPPLLRGVLFGLAPFRKHGGQALSPGIIPWKLRAVNFFMLIDSASALNL